MDLSRQAQPLYLELAETLRLEVRRMQPGDYLPGELQLAARFSVNRHTLRRAVDELVQEGQLARHKGKGTRVLTRPMIYPMRAESAYSASLSAQGHGVEALLLERRVRPASEAEAEHLQLEIAAPVLELLTLRLIDEQPVSLIRHRYCASFEPVLADYRGGSLRGYLAERGSVLTRAYSLIGARLPSREEADRLMMSRQAPLLTVLTLSQNPAGRPVELSYSTSRADRFQYQVAP
ncbi:phosphonate metabolism transcriptional regulator PhnF [Stutzerimonas nitrititolerans]|uniref:phosphonate metabolism transcriptional regulator PhnF n=1 Tax=Stutzerimonas nitrititolerans TaxID=2482751 RepID=UPI00289C322F|nr:phosphonate metabolism transcriptional regulator PhnF [Stutzerimonas nitrititolerans]